MCQLNSFYTFHDNYIAIQNKNISIKLRFPTGLDIKGVRDIWTPRRTMQEMELIQLRPLGQTIVSIIQTKVQLRPLAQTTASIIQAQRETIITLGYLKLSLQPGIANVAFKLGQIDPKRDKSGSF